MSDIQLWTLIFAIITFSIYIYIAYASRVGTTAAISVSAAIARTMITTGSHGTAGATSVGDRTTGGRTSGRRAAARAA